LSALPLHLGMPAQSLADAVKTFTDDLIVPSEPVLAQGDAQAAAKMAELAHTAREAGLWGLFYPADHGGKIASLAEYLPVAEQEGRSEYGPAIFGSRTTLDVHMLRRHGSAAVRERFLTPLVEGSGIGAYGMSEPDAAGSVPATMQTRAELTSGKWIVEGRKWYISRAAQATFVTVVARTRQEAAPEHAFSMIVVPTDAAGFRIEREMPVLGRLQGQCELSFDQVSVPESYVLGQRDRGLDLMQERLALGRTLNAIHWVGLAQRCFDLMCGRICSPRGALARLPDKQLVRQHVFQAHQAIASARCLVRLAAVSVDQQERSEVAVNMAKVAASQALHVAADSAIQIFGAEGLGDETPLSGIYRMARATRILDGADEVLINHIGKQLLQAYAESKSETAQ